MLFVAILRLGEPYLPKKLFAHIKTPEENMPLQRHYKLWIPAVALQLRDKVITSFL